MATPIMAFPSEPSAADRVFAIPELFEKILLLLLDHSKPDAISNARNAKTVLLSQRVSKTFHMTINRSPTLLRELWLRPNKRPRNTAIQNINPLFFTQPSAFAQTYATPFAYAFTEKSKEVSSGMIHVFAIKVTGPNMSKPKDNGQSWRRMLPFCPTGKDHIAEVRFYSPKAGFALWENYSNGGKGWKLEPGWWRRAAQNYKKGIKAGVLMDTHWI